MDEVEERFCAFLNREWDKMLSNKTSSGFSYVQCPIISEFYDIACMQLDSIMSDLLASEVIYLKTVDSIPSQHFIYLTEDATNYWRKCSSIIHSKVRSFTPDNIDKSLIHWDCEMPTIDSIMRRINLMEKKYNAGLIKPDTPHTTIHVSRNEGVINAGNIYSSVQGKIVQINKDKSDDVLNAINSLLTEIKELQISENTKLQHLQNIDFLVTQYGLPKEQRNSLLISTALQVLSTSADLIAIWDKFGVVIAAGFQHLLK
jgi:hypothetical protein